MFKHKFFLILFLIQPILSFANQINLMTYNIACLPSALGIQINGNYLRPNLERAQEIIHVINNFNQNKSDLAPDMIAFEEAFDPQVRLLLELQLAPYYPYNSGTTGEKPLNAGSGLLFFSKYPILELNFHPYTNIMAGDEWLANKGFISAKVKYDNQHFITVILTHLEAGDAVDKPDQSLEATTSFRRGEQMGHIYADIETNASTPPKNFENLTYLKTFVLGDFNTPLNNTREQESISTGMSNNGYKQNEIKYPGQNWLFKTIANTTPMNFLDVRDLPTVKGQHKTVDANLEIEAEQQNKFTGSTIPVSLLTQNKNTGITIHRQNSEYDVIDGIFNSLDGVNGTLQTQLVSLNEFTSYQYELSDHFSLLGQFTFSST